MNTRFLSVFFVIFHILALKSLAQTIITADIKNASCNGKADGSIVLSVSGNGPFKYKWNYDNDYSNLNQINELTDGIYKVEVIDSKGFIAKKEFTIQVNASFTTTYQINESSLIINLNGGTPPFKYVLSCVKDNKMQIFNQSSNIFYNLEKRKYLLNVSDINGCAYTSEVDLSK